MKRKSKDASRMIPPQVKGKPPDAEKETEKEKELFQRRRFRGDDDSDVLYIYKYVSIYRIIFFLLSNEFNNIVYMVIINLYVEKVKKGRKKIITFKKRVSC
jgi:hypothetical protein